ncbi:MAG: hypothetical protein ACRD7E_05760 [Bryobacteraceae bacterium]
MKNQPLAAIGIGLAFVALVIGGILFSTRQNRVELEGGILKVRTQAVDEGQSIAVVDMRVVNPSTNQFVVREVKAFLEPAEGKPIEGDVFADVDAERMLDYYKALGPKYNQTLVRRQQINPGESIDRMVAVRFPVAEQYVLKRKAIRFVIEDVDGATTELIEER